MSDNGLPMRKYVLSVALLACALCLAASAGTASAQPPREATQLKKTDLLTGPLYKDATLLKSGARSSSDGMEAVLRN